MDGAIGTPVGRHVRGKRRKRYCIVEKGAIDQEKRVVTNTVETTRTARPSSPPSERPLFSRTRPPGLIGPRNWRSGKLYAKRLGFRRPKFISTGVYVRLKRREKLGRFYRPGTGISTAVRPGMVSVT